MDTTNGTSVSRARTTQSWPKYFSTGRGRTEYLSARTINPGSFQFYTLISTPYLILDNHMTLKTRVGYELYESIAPYYSSFKQGIVKTNRAIEYRILKKAAVSSMSEHREPKKWGRGDSNPHAFRHMILSHARLPIPTLPHEANLNIDYAPEKINQKLTKKLTNDVLESFLKSRRQGLSNNTLSFYQTCLGKAIGLYLTPLAINTFLSTLSCKNGKFAYYRDIRALCNWFHRQGHLEGNLIRLVDSPSIARKMLPSVTEEQLNILLKAAESKRDEHIVSLFFDSGLRLSELCAINPSDIDWSNSTIRVVVKGNREAKAAFIARTATLLQEHLLTNCYDTLFGMKPRGIQDMLTRLSQ